MNNIHQWPLKKDDFTLIEGVFNFISFLRNHAMVKNNDEALEVLDRIQEVFEKMPLHIPGISLSLEYTITHNDADVAHNRVEGVIIHSKFWSVDIYDNTLEIASSTTATNTFPVDHPSSLNFLLHLDQPNTNRNFYFKEWREEVKNPEIYCTEDYEREIRVELNEKKFWFKDW